MKSKVIFLDIDGTLTLPTGNVSQLVSKAITQVRHNGHYVFLCTGRNRAGIHKLMPIGFDGAICSAGGYIEINGKKIYESFLSEEDVKEARQAFEENHVLYNMEATHITFSSDQLNELFVKNAIHEDMLNSEMQRLMNEQKEYFNIHDFKEYDEHPIPIHKICYIAQSREDLINVQKKLSYKYNFIIHELLTAHNINGEIIIKGTNKGNAVKQVVDALGLSIEDTICFGDSMNDLEMIQACQYSVVMGNGSSELKQYANAICESVQEDGVYHEMKRLGLLDNKKLSNQ